MAHKKRVKMSQKVKYPHSSKLIREMRINTGLTQLELGKQLGFGNAQFISNIERAEASIPAFRIKKIKNMLSKERALRAYLKDCKEQWLADYSR